MKKSDYFSRKSAESLMKYDEFLMQVLNDFAILRKLSRRLTVKFTKFSSILKCNTNGFFRLLSGWI